MNKVLQISSCMCMVFITGCVWQITSQIDVVLVLDNQSGQILKATSGNFSACVAPGETIDVPYNTDFVMIQSASGFESFCYKIPIEKLKIHHRLFSSSWYYNVIIVDDWKIYSGIDNESDIHKLICNQPEGWPLMPRRDK